MPRQSNSLDRFLNIQDGFSDQAHALRAHFESRFANPGRASSDRFVWDYWYVPDQYCLHRTPAYHFFPATLYRGFHRALVQWGRENLGCYEISPPWLSYYIEGGEQHLHSDVPHGPWAFVFSLTPWAQRRFQGGETLILRPETLSYWQHFGGQTDRELASFVERIPAQFNRLVAFDPRFPHGVTRVSGVRDPREGRLVIHGWFTRPEAYIVGGLTRKQATRTLAEGIETLQEQIPSNQHWQGTLILRLSVRADGRVQRMTTKTNSVVIDGQAIWDSTQAVQLRRLLKASFGIRNFARAKETTEITLPLLFS